MSYKENYNFFDSDEGSNSSFNQSNLVFNTSFPTSNFPFNIFTDNIGAAEGLNEYLAPKKNKNNEDSSLFNNSGINDKLNKDTNKDKENSLVNNIENKSDESRSDGKSNKNKKKILFNIDDSLSTIQQTQNKKHKKEKASVNVNHDIKNENKDKNSQHTKFSDDNVRRKSKFIVLSYVKDFINKKIGEKCNDRGFGINTKKLMTINKRQVSIANIDYNKAFMHKTLAKIFSDPISSRYTNYPKNQNEKSIEKLINDENRENRLYFEKLFNLTFLDCVNHFIGNEKIDVLNGLKLFNEMIEDTEELENKNINLDDNDYLKHLRHYFENYKEILERKKSRKRGKKKNKKK